MCVDSGGIIGGGNTTVLHLPRNFPDQLGRGGMVVAGRSNSGLCDCMVAHIFLGMAIRMDRPGLREKSRSEEIVCRPSGGSTRGATNRLLPFFHSRTRNLNFPFS